MNLAIMPARGGSKRIKNKNITAFCGRPLMSYALAAASTSALFDRIHVSTEDDRIAETAGTLGFPVDFRRDPALADDHTPLLPVLKWVLARYAERGEVYDTVCLLMPTASLIEASDLRAAYDLYQQHGKVRPVLAIADFPAPIEWAFRSDAAGNLTAAQPGMAEIRSQDLTKSYYDSGTFIFFPTTTLMAYPEKQPDYIGWRLARHKAVDIDEEEDLKLAEIIYRGLAATRPA